MRQSAKMAAIVSNAFLQIILAPAAFTTISCLASWRAILSEAPNHQAISSTLTDAFTPHLLTSYIAAIPALKLRVQLAD
jgi:hypothetical protein